MNKYRLPFRLRHPNAIRNLAWGICIALALYGLWWSCQSARAGYQLYVHAHERVTVANMRADRAMADVKLAMEMLSGKRPVMTEDGLRVARIEWERVELIRGLR